MCNLIHKPRKAFALASMRTRPALVRVDGFSQIVTPDPAAGIALTISL